MRMISLRKAARAAGRSPRPVIDHNDAAQWVLGSRHRPSLLRPLRRLVSVLLWTLVAMPVQLLMIALPGAGKVAFARIYWSVLCRLLGLEVRVIGTAARAHGPGRPVVFVANHSSWLDVPVLGGQLSTCFVAKDEVAGWPVINLVAWLGRTVYVSRQRAATGRERDDMRERLAGGDNLVLFPEGTSSDGSRVLPFRSAFFAVAEGSMPPLIQPISVVYDRVGGLPAGRATRPVFAWYGDMDLASHFWRLAQRRGMRATILLHPPLDPALWPSRKALSLAVWTMVADGAATLRQNRPASPLHAPQPRPPAMEETLTAPGAEAGAEAGAAPPDEAVPAAFA